MTGATIVAWANEMLEFTVTFLPQAFGAARYGDESSQEHNRAVRPAPFALQAGSNENMYYRRHERSPAYGAESQDSHLAAVGAYAQQKTRPHEPSAVGAEALTWVAPPVVPTSGTATLAAVRRSLLEGGGRAVVGFHRAVLSHATGSTGTMNAADFGACLQRFAPSSQKALNLPGAPAALCQTLGAKPLSIEQAPDRSRHSYATQEANDNGAFHDLKLLLGAPRVAAACTFPLSDASRRLALSVWHRVDLKGFNRAPLQALLNPLAAAAPEDVAQGGPSQSAAAAWVQAELVGTFGPESATAANNGASDNHADVQLEDFLVFAGFLAASVASAACRSRASSDHNHPSAHSNNKSDQFSSSEDDDADAAFERLVREAWGFRFPPKFITAGRMPGTSAAAADTQHPAGMRVGGGATSSHSTQEPAPWSQEDGAVWGGQDSIGLAQGGESALPPPPLHSIRTSLNGPPLVHRSTPSGMTFQVPLNSSLPRTPFEELLANQSASARANSAVSISSPATATAAGIVRPPQNSTNWCTVSDALPTPNHSAEQELRGRPPLVLVEPTTRSPPRSAREKAAMALGTAYEGASGLGVARDEVQAAALAARQAQGQARQKQYILHRSRPHHHRTANSNSHSSRSSSSSDTATTDIGGVGANANQDTNVPSGGPSAQPSSAQQRALNAWSWEAATRAANAKQVAEQRRAALAQQEARMAASDAAYDIAAYREAVRKDAALKANREQSAREHAAQSTARAEERDRDREEALAWSDPNCHYPSADGTAPPSSHEEKHHSIGAPGLASARIFYEAESHAAAAHSRRQAWTAEAPAVWAEQAVSREQQPLSIGRRPDPLLPPPPPVPRLGPLLNETSSESAPNDSSSSGSAGAYTEGGEFSWLKGLRDGQDQEALRRKQAERACLQEHAKAFQDAEENRFGGRVVRSDTAAAAAASDEDSGIECHTGNGQGGSSSSVLNLAGVRARVADAGRGDLLVHLDAPQRVDEHTLSLLLKWVPHQPLSDLRLPRYGGIVARTQSTYLAQLLTLVHDTCSPWELNRTLDENQAPPLRKQNNSKPLAGLQSTRVLRW